MAEGFVRVVTGKVPLRSYMFYLTYNDRALLFNSEKNSLLIDEKIYSFFFSYLDLMKKNNISTPVYQEMIISYSTRLNHRLIDVIGFDKWVKIFFSIVYKIIEVELSQYLNKYYFIHRQDSTTDRVHLHLIINPLIKKENKIVFKKNVDKNILENIKNKIRKIGRTLLSIKNKSDSFFTNLKIENKKLLNLNDSFKNNEFFDFKTLSLELSKEISKKELANLQKALRFIESISEYNEDMEKRKNMMEYFLSKSFYLFVISYFYLFLNKKELIFKNVLYIFLNYRTQPIENIKIDKYKKTIIEMSIFKLMDFRQRNRNKLKTISTNILKMSLKK